MEKMNFDMLEFYRQSNRNIENKDEITNCVNNNFCISAPHDMNGGILTMAFVDMQPLDEVYSLQEAFCNGTLFPNLNKPFYGGRR